MAEIDPAFERLLLFLKVHRGFDFTGYKRSSLIRRVSRQMQSVGVDDFDQYQEYLELNPDGFAALFNTVLINVTSFFRDEEAWTQLRDVVLPDLARERPTDVLRVWSAGCASGEEAFSLAICLTELLGPEDFRDRVKIYATDVDEDALAQARAATFTEQQLSTVPPDLAARYFEPAAGRWAFRKDLRRCVIFGRNDLVQDAPISRIDLLACRNTLMYFNAEQQARIVRRLHFALNPHGVLFIGKAETLLSHSNLFQPVDPKRRFFRKVVADSRDRGDVIGYGGDLGSGEDRSERSLLRDEALLTSPVAHLVVDRKGVLSMANQRADALFGISSRDVGRPFQDLELSYRPLELRSHIDQALAERRPVWVRDVEWVRALGEGVNLDVQIVPLFDADGAEFGISLFFNDVTRFRQLQNELQYANRQLETAYEELQSTNEELETTNEELQSTVEELETTNEELQSTNEELETMNEELQSMNDELQSSNDELRVRTVQITELNRFTESILASLRAAVIVLDRDLRVIVWNDRAEDLWGLRRDEAKGQHLLNLDIGMPVELLRPMVRRLLSQDEEPGPQELEVSAVNRRGKPIEIRVTGSPLHGVEFDVTGAILVIDQRP